MTTRYEKIDWLLSTCSPAFISDCAILRELVAWMDEDDFTEFFNRKCSVWGIDHPFA